MMARPRKAACVANHGVAGKPKPSDIGHPGSTTGLLVKNLCCGLITLFHHSDRICQWCLTDAQQHMTSHDHANTKRFTKDKVMWLCESEGRSMILPAGYGKPMDRSPPSLVWPPRSRTPSAASAVIPPANNCVNWFCCKSNRASARLIIASAVAGLALGGMEIAQGMCGCDLAKAKWVRDYLWRHID